jgi:long-chain acyl-CoA synthetase
MDKRTFGQVLNANISHHGSRVAIIEDAASWTYAEFGARVYKLANILGELGLGPGDRFAIQAKNSRAFEELRWAGFVSGIVPVAINWRLAPPEIKHVLEDSGCNSIFIDEEFVSHFESPELSQWQAGLQLMGPDLESRIEQAQAAETNPDISPDDDAMLFYTGGTTGRSKGVRLSHWNIISCGLAFGLGVGARPDGVFLHVAPMFHSADLLSTGWFLTGGAHCYMPAFSPAGFLEIIQDSKVSATVTVPAMLMAIVSGAGGANVVDFDLSSLKTLIFGASPMAFEWTERVAKAFPEAGFLNCYGLTEVAPDLTIFTANEFRAAIESGERDGIVTSVGKPNMLVDLRVVGEDGQDVPNGEVGELWARGPNIMTGYLNLPEETAAAISDGWLHTGDMARIDEGGYVYLLDRLKDLVITGGENVYSSEVEAALHRHPAVSEAAIIGLPDDKLGEALFAVIVLRPDTEASEDELISHCRELIGGYKIPRQYAFVEALPKSALGKVLKAELREQYS